MGGGGYDNLGFLPSSKNQDAFVHIHFYVRTIFVREKRDVLLWVLTFVVQCKSVANFIVQGGWYKEVSETVDHARIHMGTIWSLLRLRSITDKGDCALSRFNR